MYGFFLIKNLKKKTNLDKMERLGSYLYTLYTPLIKEFIMIRLCLYIECSKTRNRWNIYIL